jgi:hypothetical protein
LAWAPPLVIVWGGADGALGDEGGRHALGQGRQGLLRLGCTSHGRAAQWLERFDFLRTGLQPLCVPGALRLRLARRGVEAPPTWLYAPSARSHHGRARARRERRQHLRIGLGPYGLGFAQGCRDTGEPLRPRRGERLQVLCTIEGAVSDSQQRASGDLQRRHRGGDARAAVVHVTTLPPAGLQEHGNAGLGCDHQVQDHWVEGRSVIPTVAPGEVHDRLIRLIVPMVTPRDMNTGAIEMGTAGHQAQARRSGRGHEAIACGHPRDIEGLQGPTQGVIVERLGSHAG